MAEAPTEFERVRQAYIAMARGARYRPAAPGDGMGNINLTNDQIADPQQLLFEATRYAEAFIKEENSAAFAIGVSKWATDRAFVYAIEAARCLAGCDDRSALSLLRMAAAEVEQAIKDPGS